MIEILFVFTRNATQIPISESYILNSFSNWENVWLEVLAIPMIPPPWNVPFLYILKEGRDVMNTFSWCEIDVKDDAGLLPFHIFKYN